MSTLALLGIQPVILITHEIAYHLSGVFLFWKRPTVELAVLLSLNLSASGSP